MKYPLRTLLMASAAVVPVLGGPAAAAEKRPLNVLFLMTDQHRASALGCAGNPVVQTPNLDQLAAGGVRFSNAFCAVPYCSPTRLALVTGRYPGSQGLGRNIHGETDNSDPLRLREPCETYLHRLAEKGYHCHQLGKWHIGDPEELTCFPDAGRDAQAILQLTGERNQAGGDARFDDAQRPGEAERIGNVWLASAAAEAHRKLRLEKQKPKQDVGIIGRSVLKPGFSRESLLADYCIQLLERHRDEPFAITYSVSPPHAANIVPSPFYDLYDPAKLPLPATWDDRPALWASSFSARMGAIFGEAGFREYQRCYYGQVSMMDWCFGRILKALDDLGLSDRTLVVFTSDHGNMLGEHGMMEKGVNAFYDQLMRVPLIMRLPGRLPAGKNCPTFASSVDVAPTILDLLGAPPLSKAHGRSLVPLLNNSAEEYQVVFGERGDLAKPDIRRMIRTERWKFCLDLGGGNELYDLKSDPGETRNLVDDPAQASTIAQLKERLLEHMRTIGDTALPGFTNPAASQPRKNRHP